MDDPFFQKSNDVVKDRRFFSCIANMVLLPTPLKAITDTMTDIKAMLRICSRNLYGWTCDHEGVAETVKALDGWKAWDDYPVSWPRHPSEKRPLGVVDLTLEIEKQIMKHRTMIKRDLENAGPHYPREEVREVLAYWHIEL